MVKGTSLKAEIMDKMAGGMKAFNLSKLAELKKYEKSVPMIPKMNLTLVKPEFHVSINKPNKTALKVLSEVKNENERAGRVGGGRGLMTGDGFSPLSFIHSFLYLKKQMEIEHMIVKGSKTV